MLRVAPEMLRFGLPSALTSIPQTINLQFDQLLIIAFLPARSLGLYVVAVSWSSGVAPLLPPWGLSFFPMCRLNGTPSARGIMLATALQGGALVAVATSVPFMLLAPLGLPLIFGSSFAPSVPSALVLVPAGAILAWAGIAEAGTAGPRAPDHRLGCRSRGSRGYRRGAAGASPYPWYFRCCRGILARVLNACDIYRRRHQALDPAGNSLACDPDLAGH